MNDYQPTPEDLQRIMQLLRVGGPYRQGDATDQAIWAQRAQQAGPQQPTIFDLMGALQLALGAAGAAPGMGGQAPSVQGLRMAPRPPQGPSGGPQPSMSPMAQFGPQQAGPPVDYRAQLQAEIMQRIAQAQQLAQQIAMASRSRGPGLSPMAASVSGQPPAQMPLPLQPGSYAPVPATPQYLAPPPARPAPEAMNPAQMGLFQ